MHRSSRAEWLCARYEVASSRLSSVRERNAKTALSSVSGGYRFFIESAWGLGVSMAKIIENIVIIPGGLREGALIPF